MGIEVLMIELVAVVAGSLLTVTVGAVGAYFSWRAKGYAADANDAVNHRHDRGTPRLYDVVLNIDRRVDDIIEWKDQHRETHSRLNRTLSDLDSRLQNIDERDQHS